MSIVWKSGGDSYARTQRKLPHLIGTASFDQTGKTPLNDFTDNEIEITCGWSRRSIHIPVNVNHETA